MIKLNKNFVKTAVLLLGLASSACHNHQTYISPPPENRKVFVPTGEIRYAKDSEIYSTDLNACSALILDYENSAVFVHALPPLPESSPIDAHDAVSYAIDLLNEKGIIPKETEAIIHAGSSEAYNQIKEDLEEKGIKVRFVRINNDYRNISYDPSIDKLVVHFNSTRTDSTYRLK